MRLCWEDLDGLFLTKNGLFSKPTYASKSYFVYIEECKYCKEPFLMHKHAPTEYCSNACSRIGRPLSDETKLKMSKNSGMSKGGVHKLKLPLYETYSHQLAYVEDTTFYIDTEERKLLQVRCNKCNEYYIPSVTAVHHRLHALDGKKEGESRFYCCQECKDSCEVYGKQSRNYLTIDKMDDINRPYTDYELSIWSQEVLTRADNKCEYCGKEAKHAHHIEPKKLAPGIALDPDNGLACCVECHYKYGHKDECSTNNIRSTGRNKCK